MAILDQHLEDVAGNFPVLLNRLIGIGVHAKGNWRHTVAGFIELPSKLFRSIGFGDQPGFEVQPRRHVPVRMGRPGKAVYARMLATSVRIYGLVERHIRRLVPADNRTHLFIHHFGCQ